MVLSSRYAGYEVAHVWGVGCHSSKHGGALLPDTLRWLWPHFTEDNDQFEGGLAPWMDEAGGNSTGVANVRSTAANSADPYNKGFDAMTRAETKPKL